MSDIDEILVLLRQCKLPFEADIKELCKKAIELFIEEDNVVLLNGPVSVCGDIHGQFYDLLELFQVGDDVPETNYCFLGDYVDRGRYSLQTFLYLIALKVKHPNSITLLRGNHESRFTTKTYGFLTECLQQYGDREVYKACMEVFDCLPLSAIINNELFAVHGGIGPHVPTIDSINAVDRRLEIPNSGVMADLLWSDPEDILDDYAPSSRGCGFLFGRSAVEEFNEVNYLTCILRAHQLCSKGYQYWFNTQLITVWSAPNYMYKCGNQATILEIDQYGNRSLRFFNAAPNEINLKRDEELKPQYFL